MIKKYKKKPVEIEAIQYFSGMEIEDFNGFITEEHAGSNETNMFIYTLEGVMQVNNGDYIIKGVKGEFYPCKPDIFMLTYEEVEQE